MVIEEEGADAIGIYLLAPRRAVPVAEGRQVRDQHDHRLLQREVRKEAGGVDEVQRAEFLLGVVGAEIVDPRSAFATSNATSSEDQSGTRL